MVHGHRRINIRQKHPSMYHALMTFGLIEIALAFNFWLTTPTFDPYDIPKNGVGGIFFVLGVSLLLFLNVHRDLRKLRLALAVSIAFTFYWGIANTQQFFRGYASLQLPILFLGLCAAQMWWLIEAPVNPMTEKDQ
jgi:hypothetical protein